MTEMQKNVGLGSVRVVLCLFLQSHTRTSQSLPEAFFCLRGVIWDFLDFSLEEDHPKRKKFLGHRKGAACADTFGR